MRCVTLHTCVSEPTTKIWMKIDPYYQRQKCNLGILLSSKVKLCGYSHIRIFNNPTLKWEWGRWKWQFSLHSFTVFRIFYKYIHGHTTAFRWYDCQWPWVKVIGLFHIKFLKNSVWYGKSYYRLLIGNHTLAFDCCHFLMTLKYIWRSFQHFHVYFSNHWHAFASHGLPAIAELVVIFRCCTAYLNVIIV